ncbi:hypothetical protein [Shewanella waksmanii]
MTFREMDVTAEPPWMDSRRVTAESAPPSPGRRNPEAAHQVMGKLTSVG